MQCSVQASYKGAGFYFTRMVLFHSQGSISLAGFYFTRRVLFHSQGSISLAGFYFTCMVLFHLQGSISLAWFYLTCMILIQSYGSILAHQQKIHDIAGGCAPEASTLPPVTVSQFVFNDLMKWDLNYFVNFTIICMPKQILNP